MVYSKVMTKVKEVIPELYNSIEVLFDKKNLRVKWNEKLLLFLRQSSLGKIICSDHCEEGFKNMSCIPIIKLLQDSNPHYFAGRYSLMNSVTSIIKTLFIITYYQIIIFIFI